MGQNRRTMNLAKTIEELPDEVDDGNVNLFHGEFFSESTNGMVYLCEGE